MHLFGYSDIFQHVGKSKINHNEIDPINLHRKISTPSHFKIADRRKSDSEVNRRITAVYLTFIRSRSKTCFASSQFSGAGGS